MPVANAPTLAREPRARLPFRAVNRSGSAQHDPGLHRHHLLPCQIAGLRSFGPFLGALGAARVGLEDFRANGMLLPARDEAVLRTALPLHRGPHPGYSAMVIERVGAIEGCWSRARLRDADRAGEAALASLEILRQQLRLQLLDRRRPLRLNRRDPLGQGVDFTELDAMAEDLWRATG